jgi:hypothetical protein
MKQKLKSPAERDGSLAVYDGQKFLGSVLEIGAAYVSYDAKGDRIGTYKTLAAATRSIESVAS